MMKVKRKAKTKRKIKSGLKRWFADQFEPVPINFIAYLPLEECAARLESREKLNWWRSTKTYVTVTPVDDATYAFYIKRKGNWIGIIESEGYLHYWKGNYTWVRGEISRHLSLNLVVLFLFVPIAFCSFLVPLNGWLTLLVLGVILVFVIDCFVSLNIRNSLAEMLATTLGY